MWRARDLGLVSGTKRTLCAGGTRHLDYGLDPPPLHHLHAQRRSGRAARLDSAIGVIM